MNEFGTSGRGALSGMLFDNIDFSLMKQQHIAENLAVQFRRSSSMSSTFKTTAHQVLRNMDHLDLA